MRKAGLFCVAALAALSISACGGSKKESTATETTVAASTVEEGTTAAGGSIIAPEASKTDHQNGGFPVRLDADSFNGKTVKAEFFAFDRYDVAKINALKAGDVLQVANHNVAIKTIDKKNAETGNFPEVIINGGVANGGVSLLQDGDYFRTESEDGTPLYYSIGTEELKLASDVVYMDYSDLNQQNGVTYQADQIKKAFAADKAKGWGPQVISVVIKDGEVKQIFRTFAQDSAKK